MDAKLKRYSVSLYEKPDDIFMVYFECKAQSPDHAFSAARHLYPGCKILSVTHQAQKAFGPDDLQEHRLLEVYELWDRLSDVPVNEQEQIDVPFEHFAKDTHRENIWHWLEQLNPHFAVGQLQNGVRATEQMITGYAKQAYRNTLMQDKHACASIVRNRIQTKQGNSFPLEITRLIDSDFDKGQGGCLAPLVYITAMQEAECRAVELAQKIHEIKQAGYTIQCQKNSAIAGWWALLPGETTFFDNFDLHQADPDNVPHQQNYLGFFSSLEELVEEVYEDIQIDSLDETLPSPRSG